MNGFYNLRRKTIPENTLLDYWERHRPEVTPSVAPVLEEATPVLPEATPVTPTNALLRATAPVIKPVAEKPTNALLDYWGKPIIGKMPLDQFVQIAGALSHAIAPREAVGRVGGVLSQIGKEAYAERAKEPENILRRRLLEAQAKRLEEPEKPTEWGAFYKEHMNMINPATGKTYTVGETLRAFHEAQKVVTPKEPQYDIDVQQDPTTKEWQHGRRNKLTGEFTADRLATPAEIESKITGKIKEPKEYVPHTFIKPDGTVGWVEPGKEVPKGWKPYEKAEKPEKLTMTDVKSAYSMDIGNIKNQMMIEMTPDEQINLAGQPDVNIFALLMAGRIGKSLLPERKKYYIDKLQEIESYYGDLINQVLGRKGAKIPTKVSGTTVTEKTPPGRLTDIEYKGPIATGKIVPGTIAPEEIFKDKQGREMVKDPTSSTGWRYK